MTAMLSCGELDQKMGIEWKRLRIRDIMENLRTYRSTGDRVFICPWCGIPLEQPMSEPVEDLICKALWHMYREYTYMVKYTLDSKYPDPPD